MSEAATTLTRARDYIGRIAEAYAFCREVATRIIAGAY